MSLSDLSASTQQRKDAGEIPCGLIKVSTKVAGVTFGNNVVGDVVNRTNEYWVYLPKGTQRFVVMRPDYLPMEIKLSDYGIEAIDSKTTYILVLKETNLNPEKCGVTIHVKPRDAEVKIDETTLNVNSSGDYKVLLPKGEHICRINASGYKSDMRMVTTGKGVQDLNVELESLMADVNIVCQTTTAEIFVNEESKGIGGWKGKVMPGKYVVEARQKGYVSSVNNVTLTEKERKTIAIPKLVPITGNINVETNPDGCSVFLDGMECGKTPCIIKDAVCGNHELLLKLDSCGLQREKKYDIRVEGDNTQTVNCTLVKEEDFAFYQKANEWFEQADCNPFSNGCLTDTSIKQVYDKILEIMEKLESSFFLQEICIQGRMGDYYIPRGEIMLTYYMGNITEKDYPRIIIPLAEKMGDAISPDKGEAIGDYYTKRSDSQNAFKWYKRALNNYRIQNKQADSDQAVWISKSIDELTKKIEKIQKR